MHATDIVGYTYNADQYCPDCILPVLDARMMREGHPEGTLTTIARMRDIDRMDESSFDSGDFPKVIFASQIEEDEHCGGCHELLI